MKDKLSGKYIKNKESGNTTTLGVRIKRCGHDKHGITKSIHLKAPWSWDLPIWHLSERVSKQSRGKSQCVVNETEDRELAIGNAGDAIEKRLPPLVNETGNSKQSPHSQGMT